MSDFMSRLVDRSLGKKPAVSPRILPAFAQLTGRAEQAPVGEIFDSQPEAAPAIAPLPVEKPRGTTERAARLRRNAESDLTPARPAALPELNLTESESSHGLREEKTADAGGRRVFAAETNEALAVSANPFARPETVRAQIIEENGPHSLTEAVRGPVFQAVVKPREAQEALRVVAPSEQRAVTSRSIPEFRTAIRKAERPLEAPQKRPATEPPAIQVTIGKIEVRASIAAPKSTEKKMPSGAMSLEEYQRLRSRRSAG